MLQALKDMLCIAGMALAFSILVAGICFTIFTVFPA